jgi:hypothetical protein
MFDINGQELREGGAALLLCEIVAFEAEGIRVRVMNSEIELLIGVRQDEALGGLVADSELTALPLPENARPENAGGEAAIAEKEKANG